MVRNVARPPMASARTVVRAGQRRLVDEIDHLLEARGVAPHYVDGYRVTDMEVMTAAAEATGAARVEVEAALSKVSCCMLVSLEAPQRGAHVEDGIQDKYQ